jgi:very-short-patch-repair endonuclease
LLSPESLSAILPLKRGLFDLLIFDEASQLAIERSLPAIYRTKRVVIAGDEKQLPPFNLFRLKGDDEDEDEDNAGEETNEMLKVESLLAAARRIFGFRYLSWHYRSRFQELIDFSNQAFYEGQLMIPVNLVKDSLQRPIRWVKCEGSWNNRRNLVEANQVVEEIHHVLKGSQLAGENKPPSIGVVTFNEPQMTEVLNAIENKQESDPEFKQLYAEVEKAAALNPDRSLLVRNIENVQGYERDVMIFSIGYARDSDGKFRAQFGSLNTEGGENRLNVAITRAKQSVIVCCSFDPELLREDYAHDGPKYLKLYLLYARAVSEGKRDEIERILAKLNQGFRRRIDDSGRQSESPFEDEVYDALTATGYKLDKQVGYSGYRIDLAVANPKDPKHFILAIECDGATFHSARSARERDVVRQRFLEDRGWVVERVWSRSWWHNRDSEVERLRNRIEELSSESPTIVKE